MGSRNTAEQNRRGSRLRRERYFTATYGTGIRKQDARMVIPENVVRREFSGPCFRCGSNAECKHRSVDLFCDQSLTGNAAAMMVAL